MRAAVSIVALVALAACSDLPDLGVCGNGILEAANGEACDGDVSGEDTCDDSCELICQTSAIDDAYVAVPSSETEERYCPDARMTCALDGICRSGSGQLQPIGSLQPFDTKFGIAGDFDADGISDLVGTTATQIVVRLGATTTPFADGFEQAAPTSDSPIAIFDRDPQSLAFETSDLALAVPTDGLALMTSNTEVFGPDLDLTFDIDDAAQAQVVVRDPDPLLDNSDVVIAVARMGNLTVQRIQISGTHMAASLPTCGPPNSRLITVAVSRDQTSFVVVARPITGPNFFACRYTPNGATFQLALTNFTAIPPDSAVLAQVDDDPCADLVMARLAPAGGAPSLFFAPATAVTCAFGGALTSLGTLSDSDVLLAAGSLVPRAAGNERDELVLESGVVQVEGGLTRVIEPTSPINPWTTAAIADLNGDGILDVVAGRKNQDDIDVVRGGANPNVYRADTTSQVVATFAGDFDGDFLGDVALIETAGMLGQRISIVYGTPDGVLDAPVVNSAFGGILRGARLRRSTWSGTLRGIDGVDDLIVLRAIQGEPSRGGLMLGDAARLLTVPRIPPLVPGVKPAAIGSIVVGELDGLALQAAALRPDFDTGAADTLLVTHDLATGVWSSPQTLTGVEVDTLRPPTMVRISEGAPFIAALGAPAAGETQTTFGLFDLQGNTCAKSLAGTPSNIRATDLDGDGTDEVLVSVNGREIHVFPLSGSTCPVGNEILASALEGCADVARIGEQQVALCTIDGNPRRSGVFRIDADGNRDANPAVELDGAGLELIIGEFDGDGVLDLAVKLARAAEASVQFVRQCPAHDVRGCN